MMKKISTVLSENAALVESHLSSYLNMHDSYAQKLYDAMRYSALGGGKRIRPTLTLEFCRLYGGRDEAALPFACAVEMVHTYSLIHDDLPCMDNDDLRRGKPTNHKQFGEATALLAGDALLTQAFGVAAANKEVPPEIAMQAVMALSEYAGPNGMVGGQQIDLSAEKTPIDYETLLCMNRRKTECLMEAACVLGCLAAGKTDFSAAKAYAHAVGMAFQLEDDILDAGEEDQKTTFLSFHTVDEAHALAASLTEEAHKALEHVSGNEILLALADFLAIRQV